MNALTTKETARILGSEPEQLPAVAGPWTPFEDPRFARKEWHSFNVKDPAQYALYQLATDGDSLSADDVINNELEIVHVYFCEAQWTNKETGEITDGIRTVLVDRHGDAVSFGSAGVVQSLKRIGAARGVPPWDPPVKMRVKQKPLENGKRWLWLEHVLDVLAPKSAASKK